MLRRVAFGNWRNHVGARRMPSLLHQNGLRQISLSLCRLCSTTTTTTTRVVGRDKELLLLGECTSKSGEYKKLSQGDVLYDSTQACTPIGVVLFEAFGSHFGCVLPSSHPVDIETGQTLEVGGKLSITVDEESAAAGCVDPFQLLKDEREGGLAVFRQQPRDIERERILDCWLTQVVGVDMLVPIGRGQSMLFIEKSSQYPTSFISHVAAGITASCQNSDLDKTVVTLPAPDTVDHKSDPGTLVVDIGSHEEDAFVTLSFFIACAICEKMRDAGANCLLVLPQMACMHSLWERARTLYLDNHHNLGSSAANAQVGADRADLRSFYSSLMQRAAKLNKALGSGSLTILARVALSLEDEAVEGNDINVRVEDLRASESYPEQTLFRLQALEDKGIQLNTAILEKLGIPQPKSGRHSQRTRSNMKQHTEELKSLSDGHISCLKGSEGHPPNAESNEKEAMLRLMPFDPRDSLTRIGIGSNVNDILDTRPQCLKRAVGALRLDLLNQLDYDLLQEELPERTLTWLRLLATEIHMPLGLQVLLGYAVRHGYCDRLPLHELFLTGQSSVPQLVETQLPHDLGEITRAKVDPQLWDTLLAQLSRKLVNHIERKKAR